MARKRRRTRRSRSRRRRVGAASFTGGRRIMGGMRVISPGTPRRPPSLLDFVPPRPRRRPALRST